MFGMGFTEIILILIVAVIALGPEKLPTVIVDIAKFFSKMKHGLDNAKATLDSELNIRGLKNEFQTGVNEVNNITKYDLNINSQEILSLDDTKSKEKIKHDKQRKDEDA